MEKLQMGDPTNREHQMDRIFGVESRVVTPAIDPDSLEQWKGETDQQFRERRQDWLLGPESRILVPNSDHAETEHDFGFAEIFQDHFGG